MSGFLKSKLGEKVYQRALDIILLSEDALGAINGGGIQIENNKALIEVIGEENRECLKVFRYIVQSSSTNTTPIHGVV
jgi:hypothetical protein